MSERRAIIAVSGVSRVEISISPQDMKGNAAFARSRATSGCTMSRASGPESAKPVQASERLLKVTPLGGKRSRNQRPCHSCR